MSGQATLGELAELVGGRVSGDPSVRLTGVAPLDQAGADQISFLANPKYRDKLSACQAGALIVTPELEGTVAKPLLLVDNPYLAFARVLTRFAVPPYQSAGISPAAHVDPQADIGADVTISAGCVVGAGVSIGRGSCLQPNVVIYPGVTVGEDCLLHANVTVRENCQLGDRVILQPGAIIGADGFGYAPDGESYAKIPQVGRVVLEDDVEVGACSCIDRATLGETRIGRGTKIDNLVQVAHNVVIGADSILVSQTGIAGSTTIGRHCTFGGQSAVAGHLKVGNHVRLAGRGGITHDVADRQNLAGLPMQSHRDWLKTAMCLPHLPEMRKELKSLRQQLDELEKRLSESDQ
ncbi:MAG: UDP-3-O-(3-hydroxymyristoyl)glucosamine N-acyltransferase [Desulfuromonadales bacterium]|nr:UDP-3-O-(3-hydroxymyristoyl)glucosamine N-acyltransferase [Desulfuromonadales bacterium]